MSNKIKRQWTAKELSVYTSFTTGRVYQLAKQFKIGEKRNAHWWFSEYDLDTILDIHYKNLKTKRGGNRTNNWGCY